MSNKTNLKQDYKPDLNDFLSQCELNYFLLRRLAFFTEQADIKVDDLWQAKSTNLNLSFVITETAKYTTTLVMTINSSVYQSAVELIVRMYHDAAMVEVMEGSGPAALKAVYTDLQLFDKQVDEKKQLNQFVGECLKSVNKVSTNKTSRSLY